MDVYGYCLLQDMLSPDACSALAARILEQANAEDQWSARLASTRRTQVHRSEAMPQWKGNAERNQQVRSLHNKGTEVVALLEDERIAVCLPNIYNAEQIEEFAAAPDCPPLTAEDMARIAELSARNFGVEEEPCNFKGTMTREPATA